MGDSKGVAGGLFIHQAQAAGGGKQRFGQQQIGNYLMACYLSPSLQQWICSETIEATKCRY